MSELYALGSFSIDRAQPWPGVVSRGRVLPLAELVAGAPADLGVVIAEWERWAGPIEAAMASPPAEGWMDEGALSISLPFRPPNLLGAGANYRKHVIDLMVDTGAGRFAHLDKEERRRIASEEMDRRAASGTPFVWVGMAGAVAGSHDPLVLPYDISEPDWELELAVVIGRPARRVPASKALDYVAGYTIANDVTARERLQHAAGGAMGMDWLASKSPPGFFVLGPYVTPAWLVPDPQRLQIRLSLNGRVMQDEGTSDMIFGVAKLIEFLSHRVELRPGDVVMTGSPSGNGTHYGRYLQDGDVMTGEIEGLVGAQVTPCVLEQRPS